MNNLRPLEKIDALTEDQRHQLADWLQSHTLDECVELVQQNFGAQIPRSTINRFRKRCELADFLDTSPESARARAEIINAAASGKPCFSQATADLLEKHAFELADDVLNPESLRVLKDLFGLAIKHRNACVRERMAAVQERKTKIREDEFALKKSANEKEPFDEQAHALRLSEIFSQVFGSHPAIAAARARSNSESFTDDFPSSENIPPETDSTAADAVADSSSTGSSPSPCNDSAAATDSGHDRVAALNNPAEPEREPEDPAPNPLLAQHAIRRWRAYLPRPFKAPEPDTSWRDECPCGQPLPCVAHPDLHLRTRYLNPCSGDYATELEEAGIQCYNPNAQELGCSEDLLQKAVRPFRRPPPANHLRDASPSRTSRARSTDAPSPSNASTQPALPPPNPSRS